MVEKNKIDIPKGICKGLSDEQFNTMINVSLGMKPLWENASGKRLGKNHDPRKIEKSLRKTIEAPLTAFGILDMNQSIHIHLKTFNPALAPPAGK